MRNGVLDMARTPVLDVDQVTFGYRRVPVLREASLRVLPGEFLAVVGANGSGKTTLMRLALGLLRPTHGMVRLFGTSIDGFRDWGRIGYVPQRATANAAVPISVEEVVRTGLASQWRLLRRATREQRDRVEQVIDRLGLTALRKSATSQLSGGQQQRTLIARALVTAPELLILDEPTSGVDIDARSVLRESLERLVRVDGVAVVYISHDPEGFAGLADRVIEIRAGRALKCDDPYAHGWAHHPVMEHPGDIG